MNAPPLHTPLGLIHGLANDDYHALEALGSTGLRNLARTPLHYFGTALDPQRPPQKRSDALLLGTLAHCALLEPHALAERYAVKPAGHDGRTKDGQAWLKANAGRVVITAEQLLTAQRQAESIRALPEVADLLAEGEAEVSAFWIDEATGTHCKCRPDWVRPAGESWVSLLDLKTTQDASLQAFARSIWNYRYDLQAAWYTDGYEQASGLGVLGFVFVCVEADWPHAAAAYVLDDEALAQARAEIRELLELHARCRQANHWPGYDPAIQAISLPAWAHA